MKARAVVIWILTGLGIAFFLWRNDLPLLTLYRQYVTTLTRSDQSVPSPQEQIKAASDQFRVEVASRARANLGTFQKLLPSYPKRCYVKVPFEAGPGIVDHIWARVITFDGQAVRCQILTRPKGFGGTLPDSYSCPVSALEDWRVEMPDNTIRGDYTMIVAYETVKKRLGDKIPGEWDATIQRYVDR